MHPAQKWTDDQRLAMGRAIVDHGIPAKEVGARALAGTLQEGLEPFGPVPYTTIRDAGTKYKRRRDGDARSPASKLEPAAALRTVFERVISTLEHSLDRQESRAKDGREDVAKIGAIGKTLRDLVPVARELENAAQRTPAEPAQPRQHRRKRAATLADQLLEDQRREARGGQPTDGYTDTHIGDTDPDGAHRSARGVPAPASPTGPIADDSDAETDAADSSFERDSGATEAGIAAAARLRERLGVPEPHA